MTFDEWVLRWQIPHAAVMDLITIVVPDIPVPGSMSESAVQQRVRLEASKKGMSLLRNNVGVLDDRRGVPLRFGLANDTPQLNKEFKSADLIGIRSVTITPEMVGTKIGQFVSIEVKKQGWKFTGNEHEKAQMRWVLWVLSRGGYAKFTNNPVDL